jgi:hypothetical protein
MLHASGVVNESTSRGRAATFALIVIGAAVSGCNRPDSPPPPVVPGRPLQPQAATPEATPVPAPPPKEAPADGQPDAPESSATAPGAIPDKLAEPQTMPDKPIAAQPPATVQPAIAPPASAKKSRSAKNPREIHLNPGNPGCIEMYGTCTPPPDQLCTTSAFYLDCNKTGQLPSTGEWLHCSCN